MAKADRNGRYAAAPEDANWMERNRRPAAVAAVIAVLAFVAVVVYAYNEGQRALSAEPPLIRAPEGPLKIKPEDPGGMVVPDRDKLVYKRIKGEEPGTTVHLRPGPELPIKRPEPEPVKKPDADATAEAGAHEDVKDGVKNVAEAPVVAPAPPPPESTKSTPAPTAAGNSFYIQLGALSERSAATDAWAKMQAKHAVLAKLNAVIVPLTANGQTLYRLRAGPLDTRDAAAKVCDTLQAQNQGCFIVAP